MEDIETATGSTSEATLPEVSITSIELSRNKLNTICAEQAELWQHVDEILMLLQHPATGSAGALVASVDATNATAPFRNGVEVIPATESAGAIATEDAIAMAPEHGAEDATA